MQEVSNNNGVLKINPQSSNKPASFSYDLIDEKKRIAAETEELKKILFQKWQKKNANAQLFPTQIAAMHPEVVDFLLGLDLVAVYDQIAKQNNLDEKARNLLPRIVWKIAQAKNFSGLDQILETEIPLVHSAHVGVATALQQMILGKVQTLGAKPIVRKAAPLPTAANHSASETQLPLNKALETYPDLGEQNVTISQLKLRFFPTPVRPSIKNWITDFHDAMGSAKHSAIDRGNYLFHSENCKNLSALERQKLSSVLKSLDEETLLTIDPEKQVIVFETKTPAQVEMTNSPVVELPKITEKPKAEIVSEEYDLSKSIQDYQNKKVSGMPETIKATPREEVKSGAFSPNFASGENIIHFSSPQKLPVEQLNSQTQNLSEVKTNNYAATPEKIVLEKPIAPVAKNVINLREE